MTPHDDKESSKTPQARAEDIAYTINHSIACTLTDFINPVINSFTDGKIKGIGGCGHDHSKDGGHHHHHDHAPVPAAKKPCKHTKPHVHGPGCSHAHKPAPGRWEKLKSSIKKSFGKERFTHWIQGEFIGDFGAVPLTIATQRYAPGLMQGVRRLCEPVMGPVFRFGIEKSSKRWAKENHVAVDSPEYREHVQAVYEHELGHFPQAVAWTGYSLGLNVGYQMLADKSAYHSLSHKLASKTTSALTGMAVTAGLVVAARVAAPHAVRKYDQWTSEHFILPATKLVGGVFGVDSAAVDRMASEQRQLEGRGWQDRMQEEKQAAGTEVAALAR